MLLWPRARCLRFKIAVEEENAVEEVDSAEDAEEEEEEEELITY
jgi:hypothetical protein